MDITFEKPVAADAQTLVDVQVRAFHHDSVLYPEVEIGGPPGYDSVEQMLADFDDYLCYKIVCDGQIVGGMVIFDRGSGHYHLDRIYVDPDYHNQGIGTRAMEFLDSVYSAIKWTLHTPTWAVRNQHFYEKFGYVKQHEETADDGTPLIAYERVMQQS